MSPPSSSYTRPRPQVLLAAALTVLVTATLTGIHRAINPEVVEASASVADALPEPVPSSEPATTTTVAAPAPTTPPPAEPVVQAAEPPIQPAPPPPPEPAAAVIPDAGLARATAMAPAPTPLRSPILPMGKGMWLYQLSHVGSVKAVIDRAKQVGLTHLYLRVGSTKKGFYGQEELNRLLPAAHAAGLKVIGWDFVYLFDPNADAERSFAEISYTTPDGHKMDAFSADIETAAEGVNLTPEGALAYGARLRELVGPNYPMIATVPRPSPTRPFPFAEATAHFDAIAPMVYWMNRDPATDVARAIADLAGFGKPVLPIGQAYDGGPEGGPPGDPPKDALVRFMDTALAAGSLGVSFWVWHHATPEQWSAIDEAHAWELSPGNPKSPGQVKFLQRLLTHLGQPTTVDGVLGPATQAALTAAQVSLGLAGTGQLDAPTITSLLRPRP
jgi:hypothetical protein